MMAPSRSRLMSMRLSIRFALWSAMVGIGFLVLVGGFTLASDFRTATVDIDRTAAMSLAAVTPAAAQAVFEVDAVLARHAIVGLQPHDFIIAAGVIDETGAEMSRFERPPADSATRWLTGLITEDRMLTAPLPHPLDPARTLGRIELTIDHDTGLQPFYARVRMVILTRFLEVLLLLSVLYGMVRTLVTAPLDRVAMAIRTIPPDRPGDRRIPAERGHISDEIGVLVQSANAFLDSAAGHLAERRTAEAKLKRLNTELESIVAARTAELRRRTESLEAATRDAETAKAEAEQASRAKSEFLANMSHELRTPLNAVIGFADVITGRFFGDPGARYADYAGGIKCSAEHLLHLINDLLDISAIEAGRAETKVETFDLAAVIDEAADLVTGRAGTAVALAVRTHRGLATRCDRRMVLQILLNLIDTALEFSPPGGRIVISAAAGDDGTLRVSIADSGPGIAEEDIDRVLQPYDTASRIARPNRGGTGLGLPLAKAFVELQGGRLGIDSDPDRGTTVRFTLPAAADPATSDD